MKRTAGIFFLFLFLTGCKKNSNEQTGNSDEPDAPMLSFDTDISTTKSFKGVNWADPRDNFADDWLVLSGLDVRDKAETILEKTTTILDGFKAQGINTVRLPVNPSSVLQDWWLKYSPLISMVTTKGFKVILAYWEGASSKDGKIDEPAAFNMMWDKVVAKYINNQNVYFEIFNEPHGYSSDELKTVYLDWISTRPAVPRRRILLDGAGYATDVNTIGADTRFDGCLLSFHFYAWFDGGLNTMADWQQPVDQLDFPARTIMTEFGVPMTTGKEYTISPGNDREVNYLLGITGRLRAKSMGSVYWPGLRTGDSYSMFNYNGTAVTVNNPSGLTALQNGWGE